MSENRASQKDAENAVRLLLSYIGEDLNREGIIDTPSRVIKSYSEIFAGYKMDPAEILDKRFYDISDYKEMVLLKAINFTSFCEHHMLPFHGTVDIAYIPNGFVVGISKLARLVDAYAKRLQIQEKMTADIATSLQNNLSPLGVAVRLSAIHSCMTARGAMKAQSTMDTFQYTGSFAENQELRQQFLQLIKSN